MTQSLSSSESRILRDEAAWWGWRWIHELCPHFEEIRYPLVTQGSQAFVHSISRWWKLHMKILFQSVQRASEMIFVMLVMNWQYWQDPSDGHGKFRVESAPGWSQMSLKNSHTRYGHGRIVSLHVTPQTWQNNDASVYPMWIMFSSNLYLCKLIRLQVLFVSFIWSSLRARQWNATDDLKEWIIMKSKSVPIKLATAISNLNFSKLKPLDKLSSLQC